MATIEVPPGILDRALAVVVDEPRRALAVWKGRSRIDLYGLDHSWHEVSRPYPLEEEGMWTREDVVSLAADLLARHDAPPSAAPVAGPMLKADADWLHHAVLVRARPTGYALWDGCDGIDAFSAEGRHLSHVHAPAADLARLSRLMVEMLDLLDQHPSDLLTVVAPAPVPADAGQQLDARS
ncbi:MAG TPA: hypothetical protein VE991_13245 [Acidimicrobiales bacterium]|nr:hypothetical protein [Acidimicrobiales bacterium]